MGGAESGDEKAEETAVGRWMERPSDEDEYE